MKKVFRIFGFVAAAGCLVSSLAAQPLVNTEVAKEIPLPEDVFPQLEAILRESGQRAPELIQLGINRAIADEDLRIARSRNYPTLGIGGNLGYRYVDRSEEGVDSSVSGQVTVGANRPLFFWGAVQAGIEIGELNYEKQLVLTQQVFQSTVEELRSSYLDLVINEMDLRNARLTRSRLEQQISGRRSAFDSGRIAEEEYLAFVIDFERSLLQIEELTMRREQVVEQFKRISGVTEVDSLPNRIDPLDLDRLESIFRGRPVRGTWIGENYSVQNTLLDMEKQQRDLVIVKSRQRPNVSFSASVTQAPVNTANANDVNTTIYFAGLSVNWNVFDGFATQASRRVSLLEGRRLEYLLENQSRQLQEEERRQREDLLVMIRKQRLAEQRFGLDARIYERAKREFGEGRLAESVFRETQAAYYETELDINIARADLLRQLSAYLVLISEDRGIEYLRFREVDV